MSSYVNKTTAKPKLWGSCRMFIAVCIFLGAAQTTMLRDNLGIALLCMSKPTGNVSCETNNAVIPTLPWLTYRHNCEFDWSSSVQGRMLGAFLYGYILTTMVGGFISNRCGVKTPFMFSGIGNITFHLLCPTAALMNSGWLFACRFLQGMCSGLMAGPFFQLLSAWTSEEESSTLFSFGFSGFMFGTICTYPLSGQLCSANINGFGGWSLVFYVPAMLSILFIIVWSRYLYDVPDNHPRIFQDEYDYLLENIGISDEPAVIPWKSIFTSMPLIAYVVSYSTYMWNLFTMIGNTPMFLQNKLGIKSKESGFLLCLPFTFMFISRIVIGRTYPIVKNYLGLSQTICRKLYVTLGNLMTITAVLTIIFVPNVTKWHVIAAISTNLVFGDLAYTGGFFSTLLDIAPNYAGLLSGISTFFALLASCPSTMVNMLIVKQNTKEEWNIVFWIVVVMFTLSMFIYLFFGSASLQKWSVVQQEIPEGGASRSTLILTQSYGAARSMSMRHTTHIF